MHQNSNEKYPEFWIEVKLGSIASSEKGKKPKNLFNTKKEGLIPYIDIKAFEEEVFRRYTDGEDCRICQEGDLLIVWDGSRSGLVGRAYKGAIGSTIARINLPVVNKDFVYHYLNSKFQQINTRAKGTGTPHVDPNLLWNYSFPIAPLPEQHEIVRRIEAMFSELDHAIENLKKAREQLKTYRQAVLKHAFEGKLTQKWREQQTDLEPAEKLLEKIKAERQRHYEKQLKEWEEAVKKWEADGKPGKKPKKPSKSSKLLPLSDNEISNLPELPDKWKWSYFEFIGTWKGGGTPSKQIREYWDKGNIMWVSPKDMKSQYISDTIFKITENAISDSSANIIPEYSLLFVVRSGILRRILPVSINKLSCAVNQDLQALTPYLVLPEFIYWYSVVNEYNIRYTCAKDGTTVESIRSESLKRYPIPLCPLKEQKQIIQEIEKRLSVADNLDKSIDDSLSKAEALRQSILKQAFEGRLTEDWRRQHPELISGENSAELLLEKIKEEREKVQS